VEITYLTWTADNLLRHTIYIGLREDKRADQVRRKAPGGRATLVRAYVQKQSGGAEASERVRSSCGCHNQRSFRLGVIFQEVVHSV
jgi:hypothetical protein